MFASVATDAAALIVATATLVASVSGAIIAWGNRRAQERVLHEVKTSNGITLAALSDRAEGRRIEADVPERERTASERHYVRGIDAD